MRCPQIVRNCSTERSLEHCHSHAFFVSQKSTRKRNTPGNACHRPLPESMIFGCVAFSGSLRSSLKRRKDTPENATHLKIIDSGNGRLSAFLGVSCFRVCLGTCQLKEGGFKKEIARSRGCHGSRGFRHENEPPPLSNLLFQNSEMWSPCFYSLLCIDHQPRKIFHTSSQQNAATPAYEDRKESCRQGVLLKVDLQWLSTQMPLGTLNSPEPPRSQTLPANSGSAPNLKGISIELPRIPLNSP